MEAISLKLEPTLLSEMDQTLKKYRYSTRTEFIRDAIRSRLHSLEQEEALRWLRENYGKHKAVMSDDKAAAIVWKELEKKFRP
ncbi:MAG: ribbon-helix-helix domain-containing protein [Nanoarchaeota archaeon]